MYSAWLGTLLGTDQEMGPLVVLTGRAPVLSSLCSLCLSLPSFFFFFFFFFLSDKKFILYFSKHQVGDKTGEGLLWRCRGSGRLSSCAREGTRDGFRLFPWEGYRGASLGWGCWGGGICSRGPSGETG